MRLWSLGTGSRGNAILLEGGSSYLLIDAGFPLNLLETRLEEIGVAPSAISDVVLTHEHHDHARGAAAGASRWGWVIHATPGTIASAKELACARPVDCREPLELDAFIIETVPTPHDAAEPVAIVATERQSGARAGVALDVGRLTTALRTSFARLDLVVLEANHDEGMLAAGPYPPSVRYRIAGPRGHLSNRAAAALARDCVHFGLAHIVLAHLSERCNDRVLATEVVCAELAHTRFRGRVSAVTQDHPAGPFAPEAARLPAHQLALGL